MHLRRGGIFIDCFIANFLDIVTDIAQYLMKLCLSLEYCRLLFLDTVYI